MPKKRLRYMDINPSDSDIGPFYSSLPTYFFFPGRKESAADTRKMWVTPMRQE